MQVVLDALRAKGGQATNAEITSYVAQALELPAEVVQRLHKPGRNLTRLEYNLQWTRTYLRMFGLIDSPRRGVWMLLPAGWQASSVDAREIVRTVRSQMEAERTERVGQAPIFEQDAASESPIIPIAEGTEGPRSLTPRFPTYANTRALLRVLDGTRAGDYQAMANTIWEQRGNPQEPVDWANPDEWVEKRLVHVGTSKPLVACSVLRVPSRHATRNTQHEHHRSI